MPEKKVHYKEAVIITLGGDVRFWEHVPLCGGRMRNPLMRKTKKLVTCSKCKKLIR